MKRKYIDEMSKKELKEELETLRWRNDYLEEMTAIENLLRKVPTVFVLREIREAIEKVYKKRVLGGWSGLYGMRDNMLYMTEIMAKKQDYKDIYFLNELMHGLVVDKATPEELETMPYVTEHMELQKMKKQQKDGAKA